MQMPVVKRRHPRLAVWLQRGAEFGPPGVCLVAVLASAVVARSVPQALAWVVGLIAFLSYQWRVEHAWRWGYSKGQQDTLERVVPLVDLETPGAQDQLRAAYMAEAPSWRQLQDELVQVDNRATMREIMKEFERAQRDEPMRGR